MSSKKAAKSQEASMTKWKSLVPVLYDWLTNHHLMWPSLSCRWRSPPPWWPYACALTQTDGSVPNTLVISNVDVVKPRVLIWNVETQPCRQATHVSQPSRPDLVLAGHTENAEFALAMASGAPLVLSGGRDHCCESRPVPAAAATTPGAAEKGKSERAREESADCEAPSPAPQLNPRGVFRGHTDTVEDMLLWDARAGHAPATGVARAGGGADLHCVDWNALDDNLLLTGAADASVKLFDRRKLTGGSAGGEEAAPVRSFEGHSEAVLCVQWCPDRATVFGSCAEDGLLNLWDTSQHQSEKGAKKDAAPDGLLFQHAGHRDKVVDFHWNPADPWTIVSVSNDTATGGGTLQIWRISDLIYRPTDEVLADLEKYKSVLLGS
eukprot:jgi/Mesen1/7107/ME000369S06430